MVANRTEWADQLPADSVGAEIGVMEGHFSRALIEHAKPKLLFLVDHWTSNLPGTKGTEAHARQAVRLRTTLRAMLPEIATGQVRLVCAFSEDAAKLVKKRSLDWVYVDAHHTYEAVMSDLTAWYPKVKMGGLVAGHDFHKSEVVRAVKEFMGKVDGANLQVTTNPYPHERNEAPSFWWRKA